MGCEACEQIWSDVAIVVVSLVLMKLGRQCDYRPSFFFELRVLGALSGSKRHLCLKTLLCDKLLAPVNLSRLDPERQLILPRREKTGRILGERTGRAVGIVKIQC